MDEIEVENNEVVGKVNGVKVIRVTSDAVISSAPLPRNLEEAALYAVVQHRAIINMRVSQMTH